MSLTLSCLLSCHHYSSFEVFCKMDVAILGSMNIIKLFFLSFPGVNPCERSNGECEHLCVYLPSRGSKCLCEENSQLNENGKTCDKLELRGRLSLFLTRVDNRWLFFIERATRSFVCCRHRKWPNWWCYLYQKKPLIPLTIASIHERFIGMVLTQVLSNLLKWFKTYPCDRSQKWSKMAICRVLLQFPVVPTQPHRVATLDNSYWIKSTNTYSDWSMDGWMDRLIDSLTERLIYHIPVLPRIIAVPRLINFLE